MNSLLLLVPLSLVLVVVAGWAFAWAVKRGQFDDLDTPALDILVDEAGRATPASPEPVEASAVADQAGTPAVRRDA